MKTKPILLRLQNALGLDGHAQPQVLFSGKRSLSSSGVQSSPLMNLVVGFNGSPRSLTALDLTLCIAHQTRLATQHPVMVHVVYVIESNQFEQADRILYQARYLATEWRGSLTTHLQFGRTANGLKEVAIAEKADLLLLGCDSEKHPLVKKLATDFPCPILGIPNSLVKCEPAVAIA